MMQQELEIAVPIWIENSLAEGKVYSRLAHQLFARPGLSLLGWHWSPLLVIAAQVFVLQIHPEIRKRVKKRLQMK
jgi:hypothetical protein